MQENNLEETQRMTIVLYQRHLDFLNNINQNQSQALRTILDSVMNGQEQATRKQKLDNSIQWISFGFFFIILTAIFKIGIPYILCLILGIFLLTYGGIGGIQLVLPRTRR